MNGAIWKHLWNSISESLREKIHREEKIQNTERPRALEGTGSPVTGGLSNMRKWENHTETSKSYSNSSDEPRAKENNLCHKKIKEKATIDLNLHMGKYK